MSSTGHRFLKNSDQTMQGLIDRFGYLEIKKGEGSFRSLVKIIISQQLSSAAAKTIFDRLDTLLHSTGIKPDVILNLSEGDYKRIGISGRKSEYISALALELDRKPEYLENLKAMNDRDAINAITEIKGIGEWTANIFLLFDCGREDIFPAGDSSLIKALRVLYHISSSDVESFVSKWSPYRSLACLYLWKWVDSKN